jgi:hypothetical protein
MALPAVKVVEVVERQVVAPVVEVEAALPRRARAGPMCLTQALEATALAMRSSSPCPVGLAEPAAGRMWTWLL